MKIIARPDDWSFPLVGWYNRLIADLFVLKQKPKTSIPVKAEKNEEDWQFVFIDAGNGKKVMAVF